MDFSTGFDTFGGTLVTGGSTILEGSEKSFCCSSNLSAIKSTILSALNSSSLRSRLDFLSGVLG